MGRVEWFNLDSVHCAMRIERPGPAQWLTTLANRPAADGRILPLIARQGHDREHDCAEGNVAPCPAILMTYCFGARHSIEIYGSEKDRHATPSPAFPGSQYWPDPHCVFDRIS